MMDPVLGAAAWWSYAEGNRSALTVVVVLVAMAAAGFVGHRVATVVRQHKRR